MGRKPLTNIRQEEIINAFYNTAKKYGLENASIAKVADEMGISKGLVMHYFKNKEELLIALNNFILNKYLGFMTSHSKKDSLSQQDIEEFLALIFSRKWSNYIDDGVFYSFYALIYQNKTIKENFKTHHAELRKVLEDKLNRAYEQGVIKNKNISEITNIIFVLLDGAYYSLGVFIDDKTTYQQHEKRYLNHALSLIEF